jgi:ubiquinone/menaquinone biosynthesis C-methylase UbiE
MIERIPEPELMDDADEALAYAQADFAAVNRAFVERLVEFAEGSGEIRAVVDLGCGPADIPRRLALAKPTWRITAVDAASAMLELAKPALAEAGVADRVSLVLADAANTGLPDRAFDVVTSNSILHHVRDPLAFWREVVRLGKPGGLVFLRDLFRPEDDRAARDIVHTHAGAESRLLQEEFHRSLLSAYTPEEIRTQLHAVGLSHFGVECITDRHVDVFGRLD